MRLLTNSLPWTFLIFEANDPLGALADPLAHAGAEGLPPERYYLIKTASGWKTDSAYVLPTSPQDHARSRFINAADEALKLRKELLADVRAGRVRTEDQLIAALDRIARQVATLMERRHIEEEEREVADYQKWAATDEGKRTLQALTASTGRLQFRLVLAPNDQSDADELPDPQAPEIKLRLSKQVLLNEKAIARAYPTPSQGGAMIVGLELTPVGARQMHHITSNNTGRQFAIVLDGKILIAPVIRSSIKRQLTIDGGPDGFTEQQVAQIIKALHPKPEP